MREGDQEWDEGSPERLYVITGGRSASTADSSLDLVTLIVARSGPTAGMQPEAASILRMCHSPLSVAEVSAYLELPMSVVTVLVDDLLASGKMRSRAPVAAAQLPDTALIEAVIHGLQRL
ncbi:DUF742 domain-containing protein [Streptomyces sp. P38-E01]|uniref:DUF742 domain-containing protein n=1 Tax=Streptomyces tardus TaxID=2780544 RepID=A0A949NAG7_9ACTN|nr:DUF742 domain-containing protein [Streptomyces tardus]MBU7600636.1 DUF742 domain-containing protein [Streptomyces tardus]